MNAPPPPPDASKAAWRVWARRVRSGLDGAVVSAALVARLRAWPAYQRSSRVLSYLAFGSELDLSALHSDEKTFLVTRTHHLPQPRLTLHRLEGGLERHPYGFWQPRPDAPEAAPTEVELVLVPGLAFDVRGGRLGYGQGFYDRLLAQVPAAVPRVGVTAAALVVPRLPQDSFDVPVTHLLSEEGLVEIEAQGESSSSSSAS